MPERLSDDDVRSAVSASWSVDDGRLAAAFRAASFSAGGALVAAIGTTADRLDHHPDLELRWPGVVTVRVTTHDVGGLSQRDIDLAAAIDALAEARRAIPEP